MKLQWQLKYQSSSNALIIAGWNVSWYRVLLSIEPRRMSEEVGGYSWR